MTVCFSACQTPFEKESTITVKNLLPFGANSLLLELTAFTKGRQKQFWSASVAQSDSRLNGDQEVAG